MLANRSKKCKIKVIKRFIIIYIINLLRINQYSWVLLDVHRQLAKGFIVYETVKVLRILMLRPMILIRHSKNTKVSRRETSALLFRTRWKIQKQPWDWSKRWKEPALMKSPNISKNQNGIKAKRFRRWLAFLIWLNSKIPFQIGIQKLDSAQTITLQLLTMEQQ